MNSFKTESDERVGELIEELDFHPLTAKIYVKYNGKCAYCGLDLLETTVKYHSGTIDRLLPKSKYPELEWEESNLALSCFSCSNLKGEYDALESNPENALELLAKHQEILINKIKNELSKRMQTVENERIRVKRIIRGYNKAG